MDSMASAFEIVRQGGVLMWPIFLCSIAGLAIAAERYMTYRRAQIDTREFMDALRQILRQNRVADAMALCDDTDAPVARIVKAGLLKHGRGRAAIREALEDAGHLEVPYLERYLSGLATCAQIAPLLGLLGTVQGMIKAFAEIQSKRGMVNPSDLAEGIGNALVTTAAGLTVAIPLIVLYNLYVSRVENMTVELEMSAAEMLDALARPDEE